MHRTAQYVIKPNHPVYQEFDRLAFAARKLRNSLLYDYRQAFFNKDTKMPSEGVMRKERGKNNCSLWRALPAKLSREVSRGLDREWKSYWAKRKNGDERVRIPGYKRGNARSVVTWSVDAINKPRNGYLRLTGINETLVPLPVKLKRIKEVRLVPRMDYFVLEIVYVVKDNCVERVEGIDAGLDFGVNNFATVACDNVDSEPLIVCGRYVKSVNQWANKETSRLKTLLPRRHDHEWKQVPSSKRIKRIWDKRNRRVKAWIHWATKQIVTYCLKNNVKRLIVGWNPGWKGLSSKDNTLGKRGNQNFRCLPMRRFLEVLKYKLAEHGVSLVETEESYTSKTSVLDGELPFKREVYAAKRVKRGLLTGPVGVLNADVNASAQIVRKCNPKAFHWAKGLEGKAGLFSPVMVKYNRRLPSEKSIQNTR